MREGEFCFASDIDVLIMIFITEVYETLCRVEAIIAWLNIKTETLSKTLYNFRYGK